MTEPTKAVPCPFCGSSRIGVHKYKQRRAVGFRARCLNCGMSQLGMCHGDHEQAIAAWNTRTPQPTQPQAEPKSCAKSFQTYGEANAYSKGYYAGKKAATQAQAGAVPLTDEQITAAAKKLAECMDYPWDHMPGQGRAEMRKHAQAVLAAANGSPPPPPTA